MSINSGLHKPWETYGTEEAMVVDEEQHGEKFMMMVIYHSH